MPMWIQNLVVLALVGACLAFVARQAFRSLAGKRSKLGSCCAKGCGNENEPTPKDQKPAERVLFFPSDMLTASRRSKG